jgi:hypothetical protein
MALQEISSKKPYLQKRGCKINCVNGHRIIKLYKFEREFYD